VPTRGRFYGFQFERIFLSNLMRTWHLQLAIFWIATAYVAAALFLSRSFRTDEPRGLAAWTHVLFAAFAVVIFGSLLGEWAGLAQLLEPWFWLGNQGWQYLELDRVRQLLLVAGLFVSFALLWSLVRPQALADRVALPIVRMFLVATLAIPVFYIPAMFFGAKTNAPSCRSPRCAPARRSPASPRPSMSLCSDLMNERIQQILAQMAALEADLRTAVHDQESRMFFQIKGKRIEFERSTKEAHRKLKTSFFRWLVTNRPQNLITGPLIYGMVIPLLMLDACVTVYQWTCFPIYGITKVRRSDSLVFDRRHLGYLNFIEKFHCTYCEYGNGLMGYMAEILARTEEYFCPIKHAHKILGTHARYNRFLAYGEAEGYEAKLEEYRVALGKIK
jgi:hypothetical protein